MMNPNLENLFLLLVEDSPADVFLVERAIQEEGLSFILKVADNGETAIHIIDQVDSESDGAAPNFLLVDLNIPRRNGTEVLRRVRQSPRCGNVPGVMISSSDSPADRQRAMELGATEFFRKPSTLAEFMALGKVVRRLHFGSAAPA